jgi:hypothetical protein
VATVRICLKDGLKLAGNGGSDQRYLDDSAERI